MRTTSRNRRRTTTSKKQNTRRSSSVTSVENGIKILKYAIRHKSSLTTASRANGRGKNYISDIKARIEDNYNSKNISRDLFRSFMTLQKQYEKTVK